MTEKGIFYMQKPPRVLTIAGSAAGGSAGIQADLKTFQELDVYGMSAITAIVARHPVTTKNVHMQTIESIEAQFRTAFDQIGVDALKLGMLFSTPRSEERRVGRECRGRWEPCDEEGNIGSCR